MSPATTKPIIAISQCLLGERVRYNAEIKDFPQLKDFAQQAFQLVAICPEVEIGLGVPRPPVQLISDGHGIHMLGRDEPSLDITQKMHNYCHSKLAELNKISGYIVKARSPSCGLTDTPVFNPQGETIELSSGLFTRRLLQQFPGLPITDEQGLTTPQQQQNFLKQVLDYRQATNE